MYCLEVWNSSDRYWGSLEIEHGHDLWKVSALGSKGEKAFRALEDVLRKSQLVYLCLDSVTCLLSLTVDTVRKE